MSDYIVHGVPQSVLQDAWWLSSSSGQGGDAPPGRGVGRLSGGRGIAVLGLVLLADWMFFDQAVGLSLGLYAGVLASVCWAVSRQGASHREWAVRLGILALAVLPVIEDVQVLSLGILGLGLAVIAVRMVVGREAGVAGFLAALARFAGQVPIAAFRDAYLGLKDTQVSAQGTRAAASLWRAWALPGTLGVGFVALLVGSNPVMAHWAEALGQIGFDPATLARRLTSWGFVAVLIWPFLAVLQLADRVLRPFSRQSTGQLATRRSGRFGINSASIANSLGLFNLIFAVQTGLDLTYLWGGAVLPDGMTHATYAHRGAYPLVVTALLAGVFALISRPYTDGRPVLRGLLMLWIGQNVLLVVSALYRLDLYIGEFGLTYLRVRAAIWMGMVALGLALTGWQVWRGKSNLCLLQRNCVMLGSVLYLGAFVNFADMIARQNLGRADAGVAMDAGYICGLGPNAAAAIADYDRKTGFALCQGSEGYERPYIAGWRDWGFRKWQVLRAISMPIVPVDRNADPKVEGGYEDFDRG